MIIFETERLLVRTYNKKDQGNFFMLNGSEEVMRYIRPAKTKKQCDEFLMEIIGYSEEEKLYGRWGVDDKRTNAFVGSFAIIPVEGKKHQMQLGYALLKEHWGKGYATELVLAALDYVFTKTPIDPIYAYAEVPNQLSQRVLLKTGFRPNGRYEEKGKEIMGFVLRREEYPGRPGRS